MNTSANLSRKARECTCLFLTALLLFGLTVRGVAQESETNLESAPDFSLPNNSPKASQGSR